MQYLHTSTFFGILATFHWAHEVKISKTGGAIEFADGTIHASLDRTAFLATSLGQTATVPQQNAGWTHYDIRPEPGIAATLLYDGDRLDRVFLMMDTPSDNPGQWSEAIERERKRIHDDWLRDTLGDPPYEFEWGKIDSQYDPRSCASDIIVLYRR